MIAALRRPMKSSLSTSGSRPARPSFPPTNTGGAAPPVQKRWRRRPFGRDGALRLDLGRIVAPQRLRDFADRAPAWPDLRPGRRCRGGAGQEALLEPGEFFRHGRALDHLYAPFAGEPDRGPAGDAVEEAVGLGRMDLAVLDEEDIRA